MKNIKGILTGIGLILVLLIYSGIKENGKSKRKEKIDSFTNEILGDEQNIPEAKSIKIGSSSLIIKTPYGFIESNISGLDAYKESMEKIEIFEFIQNPYFEGKISYFKWINTISYDLTAGMNGTIENIKKLPGVEKVVDSRKYYENSKYQGYYYDAIMLRDSKSAILKGVLLKSGQETWSISFGITESKNEEIVTKILESLKENM